MKKRILSLMLALCLALTMLPGTASAAVVASGECGAEGGNVTWSLDDAGTLTISGTGKMKDYTFNDGEDFEPPWPIYDTKEVRIEMGVTSIGGWAFTGCKMINATIPGSVTSIGECAFNACTSLTEITIPDSVTSVGKSAFNRCTSLTSVAISGNLSSIEASTFSYCTGLTSVTIPDGVTSVGSYAFYNCTNLDSITILDSVTSIGDSAFYGCNKFSNIYYSGTKAQWMNMSIESYNDSPDSAVIHCSDGIIGAASTDVITSGECGAQGNNLTWTLDKAGTLTISGTGAMRDYSNTTIPPWQSYRSSIKAIDIQNGITRIGSWAFANCKNLTSVTIPDSVTSIGYLAFWECSSLAGIKIPDNVTSIEYRAFDGCSALASVNIPRSMTRLENSIFSGCSSLTSVTIPENITSIGEYAFDSCTKLKSVVLPDSLTELGRSAFSSCSSLESIIIPEGVTSIGLYTFSSCSSLVELVIPSEVTSIDAYAFSGCTSLKSVTIPVGITEIPSDVFDRCESLSDVYYSGTKAQWNQITVDVYNDPLLAAIIHCSDGDIVPEGGEYTYSYEIIDWLGTPDPETGHYAVTRSDSEYMLAVDAPIERIDKVSLDGRVLTPEPVNGSGDYDYWLFLALKDGVIYTFIELEDKVFTNLKCGLHSLQIDFKEDEQTGEKPASVAQNFAIWPENPIVLRDGYVGLTYSYEINDNWTNHELFEADEVMRLPDGLTLEETGLISGTPTKAGTWYFYIDGGSQGAGGGAEAYKLTIKKTPEPEYKPLPDGVRYVPYSEHIMGNDSKPGGDETFRCELTGTLPSGLSLDPGGVVSGVPMAAGTWKFSVLCRWSDLAAGKTEDEPWEEFYQLTVAGNTDDAVQKPNDYPIVDPVGTPDSGRPGHFYKTAYSEESLTIDGPYTEFTRLLIDGVEQERGVDYTAREGSTVITIRSQTFRKVGEGTHTIAAEFRAGGAPEGVLKRASQNYTLNISKPSGGSGGGSSGSGGGSYPTRVPPPKPAESQPPVQKPGLPFTDVSPSDWFYDDVVWAYEEGIMLGVSDTLFAPQREVSQATIVTVLARLAKVDTAQFQDEAESGIQAGRSFTGAAVWAKRAGLLPEGPFTGDETTTRNQMAVMLVKYLTSMGKDTTPPVRPAAFADVSDMTREGVEAFQVLYQYGIFKGVGGLRMNPTGSTTRAHFAALIHRIHETAMSKT